MLYWAASEDTMRTLTAETGGTRFFYNGDYSGNVDVMLPSGERFSVPVSDVLEFVAEYVRTRRIAELESMSKESVLLNSPAPG